MLEIVNTTRMTRTNQCLTMYKCHLSQFHKATNSMKNLWKNVIDKGNLIPNDTLSISMEM